jgi:hypothetical protein
MTCTLIHLYKEKTNYELVYKMDSDASNAIVEDIKNFAESVVINKKSVFPPRG